MSLVRLLFITLIASAAAIAQQPDVANIIKRSVEANDRDFAAASRFNYKQTEVLHTGTRTTEVSMIDGTPYERLVSVNGKPLPAQQAAAEEQKQSAETKRRHAQSESARKARKNKYMRGQQRDHEMMSQLSAAFNFTFKGEDKLKGFDVWVLRATPKPGYRPPTMQAQVLPGMQGEMWIDKQTYEWVKVTATVTRPVSIEGFLAQVQPGTQFEIEKGPVSEGIWQITHYSSHAEARVLHVFNHNEREDVTYSDFKLAKP